MRILIGVCLEKRGGNSWGENLYKALHKNNPSVFLLVTLKRATMYYVDRGEHGYARNLLGLYRQMLIV